MEPTSKPEPVSMVILMTRPPQLEESGLVEVLDGPPVQRFPLQHGGESLAFLRQGALLVVHQCPNPYFEEAWIREVKDRRLRDRLRSHLGWWSVDWLYPQQETDRVALAAIAPMVAAIGLEGATSLYLPHAREFHTVTAETHNLLRTRPVAEWFGKADVEPVIDTEEDDAEMNAAITEARRRWPEFVEAYHGRERGFCCVKAKFRDGDAVECMWLTVTAISPDTVTGLLDNQPHAIRNVTQGSTTSVPQADVVDWFYPQGGQLIGAFTQRVLERRYGRRD